MKAIIYARQSSGSDDFSDSVENQLKNCFELACREQLEVIGKYSDLNTSGKTYPSGAERVAEIDEAFREWYLQQSGNHPFRPGLGRVFERLGEADFIIVDEMTRLYRPLRRSFLESYVNQKLCSNAVRVLQCKGGTVDLGAFDQQLIQTLKNQIQDEAIANQKKKAREQIRKLRDGGYLCNGAKMFGIEYTGKGKLRVKEGHAEIIRYIYDAVLKLYPYNAVAHEVNWRFRDTLTHCFYKTTLFSIARQPLYCGYQWNSEHELVRNRQIEGREIVSLEEWRNVQEVLSRKRREKISSGKKHWLPLSGKLFCGGCGRKLVCQIDRGNIFYYCQRHPLTGERTCAGSRIRVSGRHGENGLFEAVYPLLLIGLFKNSGEAEEPSLSVSPASRTPEGEADSVRMEPMAFKMLSDGVISKNQFERIIRGYREKKPPAGAG